MKWIVVITAGACLFAVAWILWRVWCLHKEDDIRPPPRDLKKQVKAERARAREIARDDTDELAADMRDLRARIKKDYPVD